MRRGVVALVAMTLAREAVAHRLDEYLQATLIGISRDSVNVEMQMVPGVAAMPALLAAIDLDRDGRISAGEERAYGERVARDVSLQIGGVPANLRLTEITFPPLAAMREGLGTIRIKLWAKRGGHVLRFENRHMPRLSVYLVNCLAAPEEGLAVTRQVRDVDQRSIEVEYNFGDYDWRPEAIGLFVVVLAAMIFLVIRKAPVTS